MSKNFLISKFQAPVPKKPWLGEWDATSERGCCYQMTGDLPTEKEDCLYLNLYVPKVGQKIYLKKYIHMKIIAFRLTQH